MRFVLVAVVLLYAAPALSYRTGAPLEACTTATPNHQQAAPQPSSTNPYRIGLGVFDARRGDLTYVPGRTYQGKSKFVGIENCSVIFTGSYSFALYLSSDSLSCWQQPHLQRFLYPGQTCS